MHKVFLKKSILLAFLFCVIVGAFYVFFQDKNIERYEKEIILKKEETTPILFVGDIMLGRYVETLMGKNGEAYPFEYISDFLKKHTTVANLEGPIPDVHKPTPIQGYSFSFPTSTVRILKERGIQAVSLANNHSLDQGSAGFVATQRNLRSGGIHYFGAHDTTYNDYFETFVGTTSVVVYGVNMISNSWDEEKAMIVTQKLQRDHPESLLVAYIHWGNEYDHAQGQAQRRLAHALIDSGADSIVGMHPHVVQGIETYKEGIIFYSLGNFIFDQYFSKQVQESYGVALNVSGGNIEYTLTPFISNRSQVSLATSTQAESIMQTISTHSSSDIKTDVLSRKIVMKAR